MKIRTKLNSLLALSLFAPLSAAQQQPSKASQEDVVRVTTNLVQIDVTVTNKDGQQVTDLRPEEFEISEGGKRQQITHFSYIPAASPPNTPLATIAGAAPAPPAKTAAPVMPANLRREQVRRTIALVVDDLGLSYESIGFVRDALKKFVDEQMQPTDMVAVLRTGSSIGALQQFTSDKKQLYRAIERVRWSPHGRSGISPTESLNEDSAGGDRRDAIQFIQEAEESRANIYSVGTFNAVGSIVRGLGEMPGRKSLVLFSEAFRLFTAQGRNYQLINAMRSLTERANAASVSIYTLDASGLQLDSFSASDQPGARSYIISPQDFAATAGNAPQSTVNPNAPPRTLDRADTLTAQANRDSADAFRRLNALMDQRREARFEAHSVLSFLAAKTGGLFMRNRNDLGSALARVMEDQRGYYLIGYKPDDASLDPNTKRPRMRDITVKVKRPGVTWRAREGYFGVRDEERRAPASAREEQLTKALVSPFASGDVSVRLTSLFGTDPANGAPYIRSLLHVDANDLSFKQGSDGARATELEVVVVSFGADGQVVNQESYPQTVSARDEQEYQRLLQNGLVYILNFPIKKAGAYQMRVAVRDSSSERTGAAMQFVEAPDLGKNRLALSGVVLSGVEQAAAGAATTTTDLRSGPAVRRLHQGMLLDYRYNIHNAQAGLDGRPQVQTQVRLFRDGKEVFTGKLVMLDASQQQNMKRLSVAGRIRIGPELAPGEYVLQVVVTDLAAPEQPRTATQWTDFEIVK